MDRWEEGSNYGDSILCGTYIKHYLKIVLQGRGIVAEIVDASKS